MMKKKKGRMYSGDKARKNRKLVILSTIVAVSAIVFVLLVSFYAIFGSDVNETTTITDLAVIETSLPEQEVIQEYLPGDTINTIISGGKTVSDAIGKRPETVELTDENRDTFVTINSCEIVDISKVRVELSSEGVPKSDDKYYYLFEEGTYDDGIPEGAEPLSRIYKNEDAAFSFDLKKGSPDSKLFSKFTVAVKEGGEYVSISHPRYITNPEGCASYSYGGMKHDSIKGILPDPLRIGELAELNLDYCAYNIPLSHILVPSGGISYTYGGVTYHFNTGVIENYDNLFKKLNNMGMDVAAIVLNNANTSTYPNLTHPSARKGSTAPYYMFNAADDAGVKACAAVASFLAGRYSGSGHGNVSMWIIANEINARKEYNYMSYVDVNTYTLAFTNAFRVFYNAIKSQNADARVYFSIDQRWTLNNSKTGDYDAKEVLDILANSINEDGNIDWGLAAHPYSYPNGNTAFWKSTKYTTHDVTTPVISMDNLEVLTDYMQREEMLNPSGQVRSIILSEMGYSSTSGETMQAAAFAYAYSIMEKNGHIDALMLSRQTDASDEIAALGLALGLETTGGKHKYIYDVFKYINTSKRKEVISFAYDIVGKTFD